MRAPVFSRRGRFRSVRCIDEDQSKPPTLNEFLIVNLWCYSCAIAYPCVTDGQILQRYLVTIISCSRKKFFIMGDTLFPRNGWCWNVSNTSRASWKLRQGYICTTYIKLRMYLLGVKLNECVICSEEEYDIKRNDDQSVTSPFVPCTILTSWIFP